jgi:hypothetical protein
VPQTRNVLLELRHFLQSLPNVLRLSAEGSRNGFSRQYPVKFIEIKRMEVEDLM